MNDKSKAKPGVGTLILLVVFLILGLIGNYAATGSYLPW